MTKYQGESAKSKIVEEDTKQEETNAGSVKTSQEIDLEEIINNINDQAGSCGC